jgi:hypothetical protein
MFLQPHQKQAVVAATLMRVDSEPPKYFGAEADIVRVFVRDHAAGFYDPAIPCGPGDSVVTEMVFKYGRADIVIFHVDGTASVIEVKSGSAGYRHVVSGIGQASLYASQLSMTKGAVTSVRKCLMWSSTGSVALDLQIQEACECANTIPMPLAHIYKMMAVSPLVAEEIAKVLEA